MIYRKVLFLVVTLLSALSAGAQQYASELKMSSDNVVYWYRICNSSLGMQDFVMTDCSNDDNVIQVQLVQTELTDEKSQWKLTLAGLDDKVVLTNRASGLKLGGISLNIGEHNSTQLTTNNLQGFTITPLGEDAFSLKCIEDDGVERCLALAEQESPALMWPEENLSTSVVGWKFVLVNSTDTGINNADLKVTIRVEGKLVNVSGCSKWKLFNIQGEEISSTSMLTGGVYLVKTPNEVVKVIVR